MYNAKLSSSTIVDELYALSQSSAATALAYFYFDFNDGARRTAESLIRAVISQLYAQQENTPPTLGTLFAQNEEGARQPPISDLFAILLPVAECFNKIYLVIDALDECTECEQALQLLKQIQNEGKSRLHIIVTSRQLPEIEDSLADLVTDRLCVHDSLINDDINLYITERLKNDRKLAKWPQDLQEAIWKTLTTKTCGM